MKQKQRVIKVYEAELWQDGIMVAQLSAPTKERAQAEIGHYALMYSQDGPVEIRVLPQKKSPKK